MRISTLESVLALVLAVVLPGSAFAADADQVVLLLDNSGSMRANDPRGVVREAVAGLVTQLDTSSLAGLVVFDEHARLGSPLQPLAEPSSKVALVAAVNAVTFDGKLTNIAEGVERALYELKQAGPSERRLIVLVTDGIIDTGNAATDQERTRWLRESLLPDAKANGVRILGVAFTEAADYALLQEMAQATDGSYYRALTEADVAGIFGQVQAALTAPPPPPPPAPVVRVERIEVPVPKPEVPKALLVVIVAALALLGLALLVLWWRSSRAGADDDVPSPEIVLHDLAGGRQHRFRQRVIRVGRREENDIVIERATVSGHHARLESRGGTFAVVDLRSTNGTFVNEQRVEKDTILRNGDVLRFDKYKYAFEIPGEMDADATSMGGDRTMMGLTPSGAEATMMQAAAQLGSPSTMPPEPVTSRTTPEFDASKPGTVGTCADHPSMFATEKCGKCGKRACYSCIRVIDGMRRCQSCS